MRGMTVKLINLTQSGTDAFGAPTMTETEIMVDNVLVGSPSSVDAEMYGTNISYVLGIPRGDTNTWEHSFIEFFGIRFKVLAVEKGMDENIPGKWTQNVKVGRYEG